MNTESTSVKNVKNFLTKIHMHWMLWDDTNNTIYWDRLDTTQLSTAENEGVLNELLELPGAREYLSRNLQHKDQKWAGQQLTLLRIIQHLGSDWFNQVSSATQMIEHFVKMRGSTIPTWNARTQFFSTIDSITSHSSLFGIYCECTQPEECAKNLMGLAKSTESANALLLLDTHWAYAYPKHAEHFKKRILTALDNPKSLLSQGLFKCVGKPVAFPKDQILRDKLIQWFDHHKPPIAHDHKKHDSVNINRPCIEIENSFLRGVCKDIELKTDNSLTWLRTNTYLGNDPYWRDKIWRWIDKNISAPDQKTGFENITQWLFSKEVVFNNWTKREKMRIQELMAQPRMDEMVYPIFERVNTEHMNVELLAHAFSNHDFLCRIIKNTLYPTRTRPSMDFIGIMTNVLEKQKPIPSESDIFARSPSPKEILIWACIRLMNPNVTLTQTDNTIEQIKTMVHTIGDGSYESTLSIVTSAVNGLLPNIKNATALSMSDEMLEGLST